MKAYWITPGPGGTKVELRETATPEPNLVVNNVGGSVFPGAAPGCPSSRWGPSSACRSTRTFQTGRS